MIINHYQQSWQDHSFYKKILLNQIQINKLGVSEVEVGTEIGKCSLHLDFDSLQITARPSDEESSFYKELFQLPIKNKS